LVIEAHAKALVQVIESGIQLPKKKGDCMNRSIRIVPTLLGIAFFTCAVAMAQNVRYNSMPGTDFSKYHTYKWVIIEGAEKPSQIMDAQIKQAVDAQLATKGLTKTDGDNADLYIGYQVALSQSQQWNAYGTGGYRWGGGMSTATQSTITTGSLTVDMYEPGTKSLVWTGSATKEIDTNAKQDKIEKNLNKGMAKLFKNYPPPPKK
jgi:hypothetical protein